jgi:hypothetical protein
MSIDQIDEPQGLTPMSFSKLTVFEKEYMPKKSSKASGAFLRNPKNIGAGYSEEEGMMGAKGKNVWTGVDPESSRAVILDIPVPVSQINTAICPFN